MYAIVVYDTASKRNAQVLRTCRKYLHHTQLSVFEGELSTAQLRHLTHDLNELIDPDYDRILIYTLPHGHHPDRTELGTTPPAPDNIL